MNEELTRLRQRLLAIDVSGALLVGFLAGILLLIGCEAPQQPASTRPTPSPLPPCKQDGSWNDRPCTYYIGGKERKGNR